jgi:hypothetical protein
MSKVEARPKKDQKAKDQDRKTLLHEDAALDEALAATFPASDPIAVHSEHDDDIRKLTKR